MAYTVSLLRLKCESLSTAFQQYYTQLSTQSPYLCGSQKELE